MLRRAIQRARLHLPAPIGHNNGGGASSSDEEDSPPTFSVSYTSLRDDESDRDFFRKDQEVTRVHFNIAEDIVKERKRSIAELSADEQRRAADAWARLQTLYGLFRELAATGDEDLDVSDSESVDAEQREHHEHTETRQRRRHDNGLQSLLQHVELPPGVIMRDLQTLITTKGSDENVMPQGFTADMFEKLGNVMYNEMLVTADQNRISSDTFEELGNFLYAETASVIVSATA
ncbi:uncharacterized protein PHALS_01658 [Plasmopara halstedii]|uniref:Uncharacterized protein n=1 Tax=Plasmopara halstedii TaxID=4781 RepID=A0A0P1AVJ9_PLAHL|nr:uncharacterized protein PHALS_01658 [Plasmopara halstedii]CEG45354.1 hypothetical protein PHALS_01658 [Plasmopara halstedii]|eukprot:XP_024581723.1 hypothetical protein PHALS_01658 [Plasmopara halstedii]